MKKTKVTIASGPERPRGGDCYYIVVDVTYEDGRSFPGLAMFEDLNPQTLDRATQAAISKADLLAESGEASSTVLAIEVASELSAKLHMKTADDSQIAALTELCGEEEETEIAKACYQVGIAPISVKDTKNKAVFYCMRSILKQMSISYPADPEG